MKRSASLGQIKEYESQLGRLERLISGLPRKITQNSAVLGKYIRKSNDNSQEVKKEKKEKGTIPKVNITAIAALLLPFIPVFAYCVVFLLSSIFVWSYFAFLILYFATLIAWIVAEVAMRPPWYKPTTPEEGLTQQQLPSYWQGICHDPKYDLKLDYEDVEFKTYDNLTLRGWFIPAPSDTDKQIGVVLVHGGGRDLSLIHI
eukprot:TRINITY_DN5261_c0_g1_i1.p1 TRINITY_DN5261_c0_g1~~TRINITY_DN5261_c0_g1_i1.p1  ORF type:complete len:202 (-),score=35.87 TRINITY_DN5261_c0_g1_i1:23-628(-)